MTQDIYNIEPPQFDLAQKEKVIIAAPASMGTSYIVMTSKRLILFQARPIAIIMIFSFFYVAVRFLRFIFAPLKVILEKSAHYKKTREVALTDIKYIERRKVFSSEIPTIHLKNSEKFAMGVENFEMWSKLFKENNCTFPIR